MLRICAVKTDTLSNIDAACKGSVIDVRSYMHIKNIYIVYILYSFLVYLCCRDPFENDLRPFFGRKKPGKPAKAGAGGKEKEPDRNPWFLATGAKAETLAHRADACARSFDTCSPTGASRVRSRLSTQNRKQVGAEFAKKDTLRSRGLYFR